MKALILVDIQHDFLPGGALAVAGGDEIIEVANELMPQYRLVVATQDWHPADHLSFASQHPGHQVGDQVLLEDLPQILWPDHCIQGTRGAEFPSSLNVDLIDHVVRKGTDRHIDSYSGFYDNGRRRATGLADYLRQQQVDSLDIMGLATDYCVKFTAWDAIDLGFTTTVLLAGIRGVELSPGDCQQALRDLAGHGVRLQ